MATTRTWMHRRRLTGILVVSAFSWIFFMPVSHNEILYPIFALLGLAALVSLVRRDPPIDLHVWTIGLLIAALALYGMVLGNNNPDPVFSIAIFIAAPAMYLLCAAVATPATLRYFILAAAIGTLAVCSVLLIFIAGEAGIIPQLVPDWLITSLDLKATFRDGATQARSWGLSSLAGLGPFWVGSLFVRRDAFLPHWGVRGLCALAALSTALISDRTGIVLVIVIAPLVALLLRFTLFKTSARPPTKTRLHLVVMASGIVAALGVGLILARTFPTGPIAVLVSSIGSFFGIAQASGAAEQSIRSDQAAHLLDAWALNPIFGAGFRAPVPGYDRASEIVWSLELQYHLLLFNVGLVGVAIALAALAVGVDYLRKAALARPALTPILVSAGTAGFAMLVANATNPYLAAPGHQWALFLPIAVASVALRTSVTPSLAEPPALEIRPDSIGKDHAHGLSLETPRATSSSIHANETQS